MSGRCRCLCSPEKTAQGSYDEASRLRARVVWLQAGMGLEQLRWLRWLAEHAGALPGVSRGKGDWYWKHPCMDNAVGPFGSEDEARLNALENLELLGGDAFDAIEEAAAEVRADDEEMASVSAGPVCEWCNDTHEMELSKRGKVMCTRCPLPCPECGGRGPYCRETPCPCECHERRESGNG